MKIRITLNNENFEYLNYWKNIKYCHKKSEKSILWSMKY